MVNVNAAVLEVVPAPAKRKIPKLMLHCGANAVEREAVDLVETPEPTETWYPIPHKAMLDQVTSAISNNGLVIGEQAHALSKNGDRYFGLMEVTRHEAADDFCMVLGMRNSHDKTFPAALALGSSVFVCDNLSFSGEVSIGRKHTRHIMRDLPHVLQNAMGRLMVKWVGQKARYECYKNTGLTDSRVNDFLIKSLDAGVIPNAMITKVLKEWRMPTHPDFDGRNAWSLFNAYTEVLKGNLDMLPKRSIALHGLMDNYVGLTHA